LLQTLGNPLVDFRAMDFYVLRGVDTQTHLIASDAQDLHGDVVPDGEFFSDFSRQYQHVSYSLGLNKEAGCRASSGASMCAEQISLVLQSPAALTDRQFLHAIKRL
jgi:hypothetical protein